MTDVVRVFSTEIGSPSRRRPRSGWLRFIILLVLIVSAAWFFVFTRDSYPIARLVPERTKYGVVVTGLLGSRSEVAQSAVWNALPSSMGLSNVPRMLSGNTGLPEWVLNNLLGDVCYVEGNDLQGFKDLVFISRMTRVGKILEAFHAMSGQIRNDPAGGLHLRQVSNPGLFYAVRGRLLVISPSRESLIRALTLRPEETTAQDILAASLMTSGTEHVRGTFELTTGDPMGKYFRTMAFAARIDATDAHLKCRFSVQPALTESLSGVLVGLEPKPLPVPLDGMIAISANLGHPIGEIWTALGQVLPYDFLTKDQWERWQKVPADGKPGLPQMMTTLLGPAGPGFQLSLYTVDENEVLPLPVLAGVFDAPSDAIQKAAASWPSPPANLMPWDSVPRYETDKGRLRLPMFFGPSLEPTAGPYGADGLLVSTSRLAFEAIQARPPRTEQLPEPGNVYLKLKPQDCVRAFTQAGRQFADVNLLKGWTKERYQEASMEWARQAAHIGELTALLAYKNNEITADMTVLCGQDGNVASAETSASQ